MNSVMPATFRQVRLQAPDHVAGVDLALRQRLQVDLNAAAVERGVGAVDADEGRQASTAGSFRITLVSFCCSVDISGTTRSAPLPKRPESRPYPGSGKKPLGIS
jgi:hypothetical protein